MNEKILILLLVLLSLLSISILLKLALTPGQTLPEAIHCFPDALDEFDYKECENEEDKTLEEECRKLLDFAKNSCADRKLDEKFFCVAFLQGNVKYCDCIGLEWYRKNCVALVTRNPRVCENINDEYGKDVCFKDLAIAMNDQTICSKIKNKEWKKMCMAVLTKDMELCQAIKDSEPRHQCEFMIRGES